MWPVLLRVGNFSLYSFGFFLFLGFFLAAFAVWRQARSSGLSEEKVFDTFFLTTFIALLVSRASFVITNFAIFASDYTRIVLFFKYPGLSFLTVIISVVAASALISKGLGLPVLWLWDIFALSAGFFAVFGNLGCFLDGCVVSAPFLPLVLTALAVVLAVINLFLVQKLALVADLSEVARRRGLFFLCYLIFQLVSLLMTTWPTGNLWRLGVFSLVLVSVVTILTIRYKDLFAYVHRTISQRRSFPN